MPSDHEVNDPFLRSIAELRIEMNCLIDEQVAYVKQRVEEPVPPRMPRPAPVRSGPEPPEEVAAVRSLDPRQRLDALARHLDHRLRLANVNVPPAERSERVGASHE
jgi:hypothetical protein